MENSKNTVEEANNSSDKPLDPFAGDFFSVKDKKKAQTNVEKLAPHHFAKDKVVKENFEKNWNKNLPKLTRAELEFSRNISDLPEKLSEISEDCVKKVFSRYTAVESSKIFCRLLSVSETNLAESSNRLGKMHQIYLHLLCNGQTTPTIICVNTEFASAIIDLVLGGEGKSDETIRNLSATERTIIEFLAINLFGQLNNVLGKSTFCLQNISNKLDFEFDFEKRGAEIVLDLALGDLEGTVTALLPTEVLTDLQLEKNILFQNKTAKLRYNQLNKIFEQIELSLNLGSTNINGEELPFLEKEDIILIDNPINVFDVSKLHNNLKIYVGAGTNYFLNGYLTNEQSDVSDEILSEELLFEIESITNEKYIAKQIQRFEMNGKTKLQKEETEQTNLSEESEQTEFLAETANENDIELEDNNLDSDIDDESALATLENVMINLRVQVAGKKISLSELQGLRKGQIIELGCRPNDPVDLVIDSDSKPIASGELVEIEGQLGVRLTKIFV